MAHAAGWRIGPLTVQPSEFAKYTLLLFVARILAMNQERLTQFRAHLSAQYVSLLGVFAAPGLQPARPRHGGRAGRDRQPATVHCWRAVAIPGLTALAGLPGLYWALMHVRFRMGRLLVFLNPWADRQGGGYQAVQSLLALGHGGLVRHWSG